MAADSTFFFDTNIEEVLSRIRTGLDAIGREANRNVNNPLTQHIDEEYPRRISTMLERAKNEIGQFQHALKNNLSLDKFGGSRNLTEFFNQQSTAIRQGNARIAGELGVPLKTALEQDKLLRKHFRTAGNQQIAGARAQGLPAAQIGQGSIAKVQNVDLSGIYRQAAQEAEAHLSAFELEHREQLAAESNISNSVKRQAKAQQRIADRAEAQAAKLPPVTALGGGAGGGQGSASGGGGGGGGRRKRVQLTTDEGELYPQYLPLGQGKFGNTETGELFKLANKQKGIGKEITPGPSYQYYSAYSELMRQTGGTGEGDNLFKQIEKAKDLFENVNKGVRQLTPSLFQDMRDGANDFYHATKVGATRIREGTPEHTTAVNRATKTDLENGQRTSLQDLYVKDENGLPKLREGITDLTGGYYKQIEGDTARYFKKIGDKLHDITNRADELARAIQLENRPGKPTGFVGGLLHGALSGGFGGSGVTGAAGLGQAAGTTLKYTALYSVLGALQGALSQAGAEMLNFADSNTNLQIALQTTVDDTSAAQGVTTDYINSLESISTVAGSNVGDVMDVAAAGIRSVGLEAGLSDKEVKQFGLTFAEQSQQMAVLAKTDILDAAGNIRAISSAFDIPLDATSRINDAIVTAQKAGGGDEKQTAQALASFGEAAKSAGFSLEQAAALASRVQGATDQSGEAVGNKLARLTSLVSGSAGQSALAKLNEQLPKANQIDMGGTPAQQLLQLSAANDKLSVAQRKVVVNALGGTTATRELAVVMQDLAPLVDNNGKGLNHAGSAAEQYEKRLHDLTVEVRTLQGALKAIIVNLGTSGLLDPLLGALKLTVNALQAIATLTGEFNRIPDIFRRGAIYAGEFAAALYLIKKIQDSEGGLKGLIRGAGDMALGPFGKGKGSEAATAAKAAETAAKQAVTSTAVTGAADAAAAAAAARAGRAGLLGPADEARRLRSIGRLGVDNFRNASGFRDRLSVIGETFGEAFPTTTGRGIRAEGDALKATRAGGAAFAGLEAATAVLPIAAAAGGLLALAALKGRVDDLDRAMKTATGSLTSLEKVRDLPTGQEQVNAYRNVASQAADSRQALIRGRSGLGRLAAGADIYDEIKSQKAIQKYAEGQAAAIEEQNKQGVPTDFGDPSTRTTQSIGDTLERLASSGHTASDRVNLLRAAIDGLSTTSGKTTAVVRRQDVGRTTAEKLLDLQNSPDFKRGISPIFGPSGLGGAAGPVMGYGGPPGPLHSLLTQNIGDIQKTIASALPKDGEITNANGSLNAGQLKTVQDAVVGKLLPKYKAIYDSMDPQQQKAALSPDAFVKGLRTQIAHDLGGQNVTDQAPQGQKYSGEELTGYITQILKPQYEDQLAQLRPGDSQGIIDTLKEQLDDINRQIAKAGPGAELGVAITEKYRVQREIAKNEIDDAEAVRKAQQAGLQDQGKVLAIGQQAFKDESLKALRSGNLDVLRDIINRGSKADVDLARGVLEDSVKAQEAAVAAEKKKGDALRAAQLPPGVESPAGALDPKNYANFLKGKKSVPNQGKTPAEKAADAELARRKKALGDFNHEVSRATPAAKGGEFDTGGKSPTEWADLEISKRNVNADPRDSLDAARRAFADSTTRLKATVKGSKEYYDELARNNEAKRAVADGERDLLIAGRNAGSLPEAGLDNARRAVADSTTRLNALKRGTKEFYEELATNNAAKREVAKEEAATAYIKAQLGIDLTNPIQVARVELENARRLRANARKDADKSGLTGDARTQYLGSFDLDVRNKEMSLQSTAFNEFLSNVSTAQRLGRISSSAYLELLKQRRDSLALEISHMKAIGNVNGIKQRQKEIDQLDEAIKGAADQLSGQFNLGDIKIPTPYEIRRAMKEGRGGILNANSPFSTAGNVTNDYSNRSIVLNGVPIQQVMSLIQQQYGKKARAASGRRTP